ncbi:MAG: site-specific DNA-methyltransferase, partial [Planctomycetota bacterium]
FYTTKSEWICFEHSGYARWKAELAVRAMQYSSIKGENVLDLFGGSGSTLIAAEQTGRRAFLMELDPLYCDVIVQRFENFTGKKARRISSAESKVPIV